MWRYLVTVLGSAALGSFGATVGLSLFAGGTGSPEGIRFLSAFTLITMMFTIPASMMLIGLHAILAERRLGSLQRHGLVALFGALSGSLLLGLASPSSAGLGAFYGLATAAALTVVQGMLDRARA